ncbi:MAG: protein kinase [Gemmatimonadota bacterium]|jgi:serine/threonine-protein kinase
MGDTIDRLNAALADRYRIERELGAGGMATVYLAEDLKHQRKVALKVLKPELAAVVGAERFLAEIRTTANLQHPHILALFDSGDADGFLYYVMPYVTGESLRDRLDREKQLPIDDAIRIGVGVANALDYAHRHDIIHRDIKPANILLHDGQPVVADFGIALAIQQAGGGRLTETGLSLGTPYYMSPEQATADRDPSPASDVYSLACVVYEMITGEPPFTGTTAQAVLGRILTGDVVPPGEQRKSLPDHVEAAVLQALEKLPADRFRTAADFARALEDPTFASNRAARAGPLAREKATYLPWGLLAVTLVALLFVIVSKPSSSASPDIPPLRASLDLAANQVITGQFVAISNDGRRIAVQGTNDGVDQILVRDLSEDRFTPVANTDGAEAQFFSPDGTQLAFRGGGAMRQVSTDGGPTTVLDDDAEWGYGEWAEDGTLYYPRSYVSGLWRKSPDGAPEMLTQPDSGELAHWHPQLLPDGRHLLFTAFRTPIDSAALAVLDLETGSRRTVLRGAVHGRYVPTGHLLYARANTIFAIRFDPETMETSGRPVAVIEDVQMSGVDGLASFAVSENGVAVYVRASEYDAPSDLVWIDRKGNATPAVSEAAAWEAPSLSPDGRSVAVAVTRPGESADVWVLDLARGARSPLTVGGGADFQPLWSPDGEWIIYASENPVFQLFRRRADGSGARESLVSEPFDSYPYSFTADGSRLLFESNTLPESTIKSVAMDGSGGIETVQAPAEGDLSSPQVSPDGRLLAFTSEQSGREEVYVARWPGMSNRQTVSLDGGTEPRWTKGGRELVFRHGTAFLALTLDPESAELGTPRVLFNAPIVDTQLSNTSYDVTADGERFIMATRPTDRAPRRVMVITRFFELLKRTVPN